MSSGANTLFQDAAGLITECPPYMQNEASIFLRHRQENVTPEEVLSAALCEKHFPYIVKIITKTEMIANGTLNGTHIAALLYMPENSLRYLADHPGSKMDGLFAGIQTLHYLSFNTMRAIPFSPAVEKCQQYDNHACIVTGCGGISQSCHVIPFSSNVLVKGGEEHRPLRALIGNLLGFTSVQEQTMAVKALFRILDEVQKPSRSWNLITLSPNLRTMWESGMFALKWLSSETIDTENMMIKLQFVWMPFNVSRRRRYDYFDIFLCDLREELKHVWGKEEESLASPCMMSAENCQGCKWANTVCARNVHTGRRIRSGDVFTIVRDKKDVLLCRFAFNLQWILVCAHAVSGNDYV